MLTVSIFRWFKLARRAALKLTKASLSETIPPPKVTESPKNAKRKVPGFFIGGKSKPRKPALLIRKVMPRGDGH